MTKEDIITAIKEKRISLELSQQQLADRIGTQKGHISLIEAGKKDITISTLCNLTKALDIQIKLL